MKWGTHKWGTFIWGQITYTVKKIVNKKFKFTSKDKIVFYK